VKVRVTFTVDVDPEAWSLNYGTGTDPADVREDVRRYVENGAVEQLREVGVLAEAGS
jgi:hypothetical protein